MKIDRIVLSVCVTFFLISCKSTWNWEPNPYEASHIYKSILNAEGHEVFAAQPEFDDFTCFPSKNVAELQYNIQKLKINKKVKRAILKEFNKFESKRNYIKQRYSF